MEEELMNLCFYQSENAHSLIHNLNPGLHFDFLKY